MTDYNSRREVFTEIYETNHWGGKESFSGEGSSLAATKHIREELPKIIQEYGITSILDVPCGDFNWMKTVDLNIPYHGVDIVQGVIDRNNDGFSTLGRSFHCLDATIDELPQADLVFCRDMLQHLSYTNCWSALYNFIRTGARYLLVTSYNDTKENEDIQTGQYFPYNLFIHPFDLGPALRVVTEGGLAKNEKDKAMFLFKIGENA